MSYVVLLLSVLVVQPEFDRAKPEKIRRALDGVLDSRYQTELPRGDGLEDWDELSVDSRSPGARPDAPDLEGLARVLLIALALVGGIALTAYLVRLHVDRPREVSLMPESVPQEPRPRVADLLARARELAGGGRFGDAVHLLLLGSVQLIEERRGGFRRSRTVREIVMDERVPTAAREPLAHIAARAEPVVFGDRDAMPADFDACREWLGEIERALASGGRR